MSHFRFARLSIAILLVLLPIHSAKRIQTVEERMRDDECAKAVPGTKTETSYFWSRSQNCKCIAENHIIHGPPACWSRTGFRKHFLAEELLDKGCQCMTKEDAETHGSFVKYDWNKRASELCGNSDAKIVYWVRHAAGHHQNYLYLNTLLIQDPELTDVGITQANNLANAPNMAAALYNATQRAQLVIASPLRRTMATAIHGFNESLSNVPWLVDADIQEVPGKVLCNIGDARKGEAMLNNYGRSDLLSKYQKLHPDWLNRKKGRFADDMKRQRFNDFTARLEQRQEKRIIVVSHGLFMRPLGKNAPGNNCAVKPFALCGGNWHFLG